MLRSEINGWKTVRTRREGAGVYISSVVEHLLGKNQTFLSVFVFLDALTSNRKLSSKCVHTE